jgi:hypothetical protein
MAKQMAMTAAGARREAMRANRSPPIRAAEYHAPARRLPLPVRSYLNMWAIAEFQLMKAKFRVTASIVPALLFCVVTIASAQPVRLLVYGVRHTTDTIRIDGVLDESTWALASRAGEIRRIDEPTRRPSFPSEVTLAWDAKGLYVAFACTDATPSPRLRKRDDPLWDDEAIQVLLDPDGAGRNYVELAVNAENVIADRMIPDASSIAKADIAWNMTGVKTAVGRHRAGWVVEIAIPWSALAAAGVTGPPKPGEQWRAALYRVKRLTDGLERTAWSAPRADRGVHDTDRFGHLLFMPPHATAGQ